MNDDIIRKGEGIGWGNKPIKIFYTKWPDHETGSVFWTYERNLETRVSRELRLALVQ